MGILEKIDEKQIKGYLTINRRIIYPGGIYHVTQRAPGKEMVFLATEDYLRFLGLVKEASKKFESRIFAFALLTNHLHLLLQLKEANLSEMMKHILERYAKYYNTKYCRKGHVFCGRFRASLCNDESYLLSASIYIHLNPYRAGLCDDFRAYRWSSIKLYTEEAKSAFVDYAKILGMINSDIKKAQEEYTALLKKISAIKNSFLLDPMVVRRSIRSIVKKVDGFGADRKVAEFEQLLNELRQKKRLRRGEEKRARKYIVQQLISNGYTASEIMEILAISKSSYQRAIREKGV